MNVRVHVNVCTFYAGLLTLTLHCIHVQIIYIAHVPHDVHCVYGTFIVLLKKTYGSYTSCALLTQGRDRKACLVLSALNRVVTWMIEASGVVCQIDKRSPHSVKTAHRLE